MKRKKNLRKVGLTTVILIMFIGYFAFEMTEKQNNPFGTLGLIQETIFPETSKEEAIVQGEFVNLCKAGILAKDIQLISYDTLYNKSAYKLITPTYSKFDASINKYAQETLANEYNNSSNNSLPKINVNKCGGICWASVATAMLEYEGAKSSPYTKAFSKEIFKKVVENAVSDGLIGKDLSVKNGIDDIDFVSLFSKDYPRFFLNRNIKLYGHNALSKLKTEIDTDDVPALGLHDNISSHLVSVWGYDSNRYCFEVYDFSGRYRNVSDVVDLLIVNSTWGRTAGFGFYGFIPENNLEKTEVDFISY